MKKLIIFLFLFTSFFVAESQVYQKQNSYGFGYKRLKVDSTLHIPTFNGIPDLRGSVVDDQGAIAIDSANKQFYFYDPKTKTWNLITGGGSGGIIPGGPITSLPSLGYDPGANITSDNFINAVFYQSQAPTASLTGGANLEFRGAQTMNYTLNWSGGRASATEPLASIIVAGVAQSFSPPAAGSSISGTQTVSFPANTSITYSNIVTTTDSKSTTASTTFSFLPMRYFGWINVSDTAGIGTFGYDDSKITALTNELSASKVKSWNTGSPTGTQIYVYAYYYTAGALNNLILNGFPSIDAFNVAQRQFTNALGFTGQWIIYWNKNSQTLSSDIIAN